MSQDIQLSEEDKECVMDLQPYMNQAPYVVAPVSTPDTGMADVDEKWVRLTPNRDKSVNFW